KVALPLSVKSLSAWAGSTAAHRSAAPKMPDLIIPAKGFPRFQFSSLTPAPSGAATNAFSLSIQKINLIT
ncbi:MAG: hypothetical protein WAU90_03960, partial [Methyloceanibacter sp.]